MCVPNGLLVRNAIFLFTLADARGESIVMTYDEAVTYTDEHAERRDAKQARRSGMVVSNRGVKTVLLPLIAKPPRRRKGVKRHAR